MKIIDIPVNFSFKGEVYNETELRAILLLVAKGNKELVGNIVTDIQTGDTAEILSNGKLSDSLPSLHLNDKYALEMYRLEKEINSLEHSSKYYQELDKAFDNQ